MQLCRSHYGMVMIFLLSLSYQIVTLSACLNS